MSRNTCSSYLIAWAKHEVPWSPCSLQWDGHLSPQASHLVHKYWRYGGIESQLLTAISPALLETSAQAQATGVLRREELIPFFFCCHGSHNDEPRDQSISSK